MNLRAGWLHQLTGIVSEELAIVWEALQAAYSATDRASASSTALARVGALTGTLPRPATRSTVLGTVRLGPGATLPNGSLAAVTGEPGAQFRTVVEVTNPSGAAMDIDVEFEALDTGPVPAPAGTLAVIIAPVAGWISIINALDAELGMEVEDDAAYRGRQQDELTASGGGTVDAIRADLLRVPGVGAVRVLENVLDVVSPKGLPPHSVEAIVLDGRDQDIADQLWRSKPTGIETHETVMVAVEDSAGDPHPIWFSWARRSRQTCARVRANTNTREASPPYRPYPRYCPVFVSRFLRLRVIADGTASGRGASKHLASSWSWRR